MKTKLKPNKKLINIIITLVIIFLFGGFVATTVENNDINIESKGSGVTDN